MSAETQQNEPPACEPVACESVAADSGSTWAQRVQREASWVLHRIASRVEQIAEAEDLTQEVLLSAIENEPLQGLHAGIRPWLYRILVRRVSDHFRRRSSETRGTENYAQQLPAINPRLVEGKTATSHPGEPDPSAAVHQAIASLPPEMKRLIELKFQSGWSYRRLAQHFKTTERTIEYRLLRAKQSLRRWISENCGDALRGDTHDR
ncbi:MAG: sigma-70 family RNA polymerase sigma factor [Planctomycetota bacterium]